MYSKCMFLENGKCLCQKRYYETGTCPDCEKIRNCYYKRALKYEKLSTLLEKVVGYGIKIRKEYIEYRATVKNKYYVGTKLSELFLEIVKDMEENEDDE